MAERRAASDRVAQSYERGAQEGEKAITDLTDTRTALAAERVAARPAPLEITKVPSAAARPFLQPGDSILGQLQTLMLAVGQMGMQAYGLRGSAIASVAAMKGMAEGWSAGDAERIKHQYSEWKANSERLIEQHRASRESYRDLLEEHGRTMEEKLQGIRLRASINGNKTLAEIARLGNIDATLKHLEYLEGQEIQVAQAQAQMAHWYQQAAQHQQNFLATEAQRLETNARARETHLATEAHRRQTEARASETGARGERRLKLAEAQLDKVFKLQQQEIGFTAQLDNLARVRDSVALLASEKLLPDGATFIDKTRASITLQTKTGRQDIGNAVETLRRLALPLLAGTEVSLGMPGALMRLKAVGEAEVGNVTGIPKAFWDQFLPLAEKNYLLQRDMARRHLDAIGRTAPASGDYEILSTSP